jgi:acyl carrier protein
MRQATETALGMQHFVPAPSRAFAPQDDAALRDALKRCSAATREAASAFRRTGDPEHLPAIVHGLIEHYVDRDLRSKLGENEDRLRLVEDLALDSLTMMEIVFLAEDVLQVSIDNEELRPFRTVGDIKKFLASRVARDFPGLPAD